MKLTIELSLDNGAYHYSDEPGGETFADAVSVAATIARAAADVRAIESLRVGDAGRLKDLNGNTVGSWRVSATRAARKAGGVA